MRYLPYPANYGILPRTVLGRDLGGDGDPLDIVVLGPAVPPATLVVVQVLGTIRLVDGGERDDKLIAAPVGSPLAACRTVDELDRSFPGVSAILRTWFENYKGPGRLRCDGFGSEHEARELLAAARRSFEASERAAAR
ncbi:MAG: inorganic diphosphatase [Planctomycetes bacterium]|nr:inorganic diphosphatase [Planctomycetota bacterium]